MVERTVQASFNSGEWSPTLYARVDLAKYRSGAALLENFFVDYRGGASTRMGTQYILQAYKSEFPVRLIPFQASTAVGYILEFGENYIRFFNDGSPVLADSFVITDASQTDPLVIEVVGNDFEVDDWVFIDGVVGMTQINNKYFVVLDVTGDDVTLGAILDGSDIDATGYTAYGSAGAVAKVYTIGTNYAAADLALLKFTQDVDKLILTHPDYPPAVLTLISANNWTLVDIVFGVTLPAPANFVGTTTLAAGSVHYSYRIAAVGADGQESTNLAEEAMGPLEDLRTTAGTIRLTWTAVSGAISYNIYKATESYSGAIASGAQYGFAGNVTGTTFDDSNIAADYSTSPQIPQNPFQGAGVASVTVTAPGAYTTVPSAVVDASPTGLTAVVQPFLTVIAAVPTTPGSGDNTSVGVIISPDNVPALDPIGSVRLRVESVDGGGQITSVSIVNPGSFVSGTVPSNPVAFRWPGRDGGSGANIDLTWGVGIVGVVSPGAGYTSVPAITFSAGAAAATAVLGAASAGNPSVPAFFQQRLVLAAQTNAPQTFHMSQPGAPYNFNIQRPIQPDNAISGELTGGQLNVIKAMVPMPSGLVTLTDKAAWLINGGGTGEGITPINATANTHAYNGISDVPAIIANFDILYVQAKGSTVRNLAYNFQTDIFTGTDITVLSSHLFHGHRIVEWSWAEEPFKVAWAIRDDGVLLSLTFLKEQEFIGWAHSITDGLFKSTASITEQTVAGVADATYFAIEREIAANTVKYIERFADHRTDEGAEYAWQVDSGLAYEGSPATSFSGGEHLAGKTVTGTADGEIITPFVMPVDGNFTLAEAASHVHLGIGFVCRLQTLAIDLGEPTIQGEVKNIPSVTVRVADALNLRIGSSFDHLVEMKDLFRGNVSSTLVGQDNQLITDLVTGDAFTILDSTYTVPGQYCIQQSDPLPATILGCFPNIQVSSRDTSRAKRGQ